MYRPVRNAPTSPQSQKTTPYQWSCRSAARIGSLEKKPENAGMPTSARAPSRNAHFVSGITFPTPRSFRMSCSSAIAWMTRPAVMNSSALKKACVIRWNMPFAYAPTPTAMNM